MKGFLDVNMARREFLVDAALLALSRGNEAAETAAPHAAARHIFASMSGMLDLSSDENAKHFLPRWLRDAPT